jgi:Mg-chelatase subunit ChlD
MGQPEEPHIPVAYAVPMPAGAPAQQQPSSNHYFPFPIDVPAINGGRSSRVMLPPETTSGITATTLTEEAIQVLRDQGYTRGLAEALSKNKQAFPLSIWIVDNSGSMASRDGHRLIETKSKDQVKLVSCTRWAELQQTVLYHAQMAAHVLQSPILFRLLNDPGHHVGPQQFSICHDRGVGGGGYNKNNVNHDLSVVQSTMMSAAPDGATPLIAHLQEIRQDIIAMSQVEENSLRRHGTKVALVVATDGLPSNKSGISDDKVKQQFIETLQSLQGLPVWVVIRLCTDDAQTVQFYNSLDDQLELSIEVLDDFSNEAQEMHTHNAWLNYGLPLHRMRELGFHNKLLDLMDERPLTMDELRDFFRILFGDAAMQSVPDPQADWCGFVQAMDKLNRKESKTWNPVTKRVETWIDMSRLKNSYGPGWMSLAFGWKERICVAS